MCHCDRICMAAFPVQETTCDFCFELSLQKVNSFEQGVNVEIFFRFFFFINHGRQLSIFFFLSHSC